MRTAIAFFTLLLCLDASAQDSLELKRIDSLVKIINLTNLPVQKDTIVQDRPELGLKMKTCLAMISAGNKLMKYENKVYTISSQNGITRELITSTTFYYDHNQLIKVEEYGVENDKKMEMNWYYAGDKPLYYSLKSEKAASRAHFLLSLSKQLVKKE